MEPVVIERGSVRFEPLGIESALVAEIGEAVGADRSSTLGAGFARFEGCRFPWTLSCDETMYVIEGSMTLLTDDRELTAGPGDIVFLPEGSEVEYRFEDPCLLFYATYPVDWSAAQETRDGTGS